jgi:hypothetical protein
VSSFWPVGLDVDARRRLWIAAVAAVGALVLVMLSMTAPVAGAAPRRAVPGVKGPGTFGELVGVTTVPHSTDVWAFGQTTAGRNFVARRHDGHWKKVKAPNFGGHYGQPEAIAAGSSRTVWLIGARQLSHSIQQVPAIWRWNGKRFTLEKLPKMQEGDVTFNSISASSATNAWAVGGLYLPNDTLIALHWNGKKWLAVATPDGAGLNQVGTSSSTNAWALGATGAFDRWNGTTWIADGTQPTGVQLNAIATTSPKLVYAVGFNSTTSKPVIMKFNGTTWSNAPLAANVKGAVELRYLTMHGRSAWAMAGPSSAVIMHSNGGAWTRQQSFGTTIELTGISAQSSKHAYAVGLHDDIREGYSYAYTEFYNGHSWKGTPTRV